MANRRPAASPAQEAGPPAVAPPEAATAADVVLQRVSTGIVAIVHPGSPQEQHVDLRERDLAGFVAKREAGHDGGTGRPRWVWDDTSRWYPALLGAGVRIERCTDLRLCHLILRDSPLAASDRLTGPDEARWSQLLPVSAQESEPDSGLFTLHEHAGWLDAAAEYQRQAAAVATGSQPGRLRLLLAAESSGALAATEMTHVGLPWRTDVHERLLADLLGPRPAPGQRPAVLDGLLTQVREAFGAARLNPDSPPELLAALRAAGLPVTDTRGRRLEHLDHPGIAPLLEYKKLQRLNQANGWRWIDSWVREGRYRPDYRPGGVVTGRWAAHGGGALSLPAQVRPAVVADDGWCLVVADVAQLEPRILAAMSGDRALASAARATDLYGAMVAGGVVPTREQAKMGILGAMYGGTRGESGRMLPRLRSHYPDALDLVEQAARDGERGLVVHTLLGRGSPAPTGAWAHDDAAAVLDEAGPGGDASTAERRAWGRFTRNFIVQGTGAEWALSWLALLRNLLWQLGSGPFPARPQLCFFLHDEVVVHTPAALAGPVAEAVETAAVQAGRLLFGASLVDFPLTVSTVRCYADAD